MGHTRQYIWRVEDGQSMAGSGFDPADILCELYGDSGMRTRVLDKDDLKGMAPWYLCSLLNEVYKAGREDAMADLRMVLGIK